MTALENIIDEDNNTCISLTEFKQGAVFDLLVSTFPDWTTPGCQVTLTVKTSTLQSLHWIVLVKQDNEWQDNCQTGTCFSCSINNEEHHTSTSMQSYAFTCPPLVVCSTLHIVTYSFQSAELCEIILDT